MTRGAKIPGFDYEAGKPVEYTAAEWRAKYPPADYHRAVTNGETWYRCNFRRRELAAEAYAVIPEGRGK